MGAEPVGFRNSSSPPAPELQVLLSLLEIQQKELEGVGVGGKPSQSEAIFPPVSSPWRDPEKNSHSNVLHLSGWRTGPLHVSADG